jgi:hypothetical protein
VLISCLHTAETNVAVFEEAAATLGLPAGTLRHEVRADLLAAAEAAGGLTPEIARETSDLLLRLSAGSDCVLLTCSTLGPSVVEASETVDVPVFRVDGALAEKAVGGGGKVVVLCAVETTVAPTTQVFAEAAARTGATVEVRLVPGAWALFKAGDPSGYFAAVAQAADAAYDEGVSVVALAQASMSGAAVLMKKGPPPLSSPLVGLAKAVAAAG